MQVLGDRYQLHEPIARGGMAVVWRANDLRLNRYVAIKILHARFRDDADFRERFRREAVAAASFNHPNIVTVYDAGEEADSHYIVMELVEGLSLSRLVGPSGTLSPSECTTLLRSILLGLSYAHGRGVIHRDIKPANILLSKEHGPSVIKLGDFGIARALAHSDLTATGAIIGTASYLAPEQAAGRRVDFRSDLYSLACVAYKMLTGRLPWIADSDAAVAFARTTHPPAPLSPLCPQAPPQLIGAIEVALERNPDQRHQNAQEMLSALYGVPSSPLSFDRSALDSQLNTPAPASPRPMPAVGGSARAGQLSKPQIDSNKTATRLTAGAQASRWGTSVVSTRPPDHVSPRQPAQPAATVSTQLKSRQLDRNPRNTMSNASVDPSGDTAILAPAPDKNAKNDTQGRRNESNRPRARHRRFWSLLSLVSLAAVIVLLVAIFPHRMGNNTGSLGPTQRFAPVRMYDFDPAGNDGENPHDIILAADNDPETSWSTEIYNTQKFGNLKSGVGLVFDMGSAVKPGKVSVTVSPGTSLELRHADQPTQDISQWHAVPGSPDSPNSGSDPGGDSKKVTAVVDTGSISARYWLVWLTTLSPYQDGRGRSRIFDVKFGKT